MQTKAKSGRSKMNDRLILFFGIPIVAIIALLLLGKEMLKGETQQVLVSIASSLSSTVIMWLGVRNIVIFLWNKYPWERNPVKHLIIEVLAILVYTALAGLVLTGFWFVFHPEALEYEDLGVNIFFTLIITFFITSLHEGYFFFIQWKKTLVLSEKLEKENIQSQYETLKNQISPHFLFNNLNTLANQIEEDPKSAVEFVQRTADYFRYILNLKDKDIIPLDEELKLIEDYYFLQKKRYGDNLNLKVNISNEALNSVVAPLTIQMLFENAIKHNIISTDKPLQITIHNNDNYLIVENNFQRRESSVDSNRMGLQNIANRYRYLSGKEIEVEQNNATFTVKVPILNLQP